MEIEVKYFIIDEKIIGVKKISIMLCFYFVFVNLFFEMGYIFFLVICKIIVIIIFFCFKVIIKLGKLKDNFYYCFF